MYICLNYMMIKKYYLDYPKISPVNGEYHIQWSSEISQREIFPKKGRFL